VETEKHSNPDYILVAYQIKTFNDVAGRISRQSPTRVPLPVVDMSSGVYGALGIMYALRHRDMTGEGQLVDIATAMADPQVQAREMLVDIDYGGDLGQVPVPGVVVKISKTPGRIDKPCPSPGQDNKEVYGKILRLKKNELDNLEEEGII